MTPLVLKSYLIVYGNKFWCTLIRADSLTFFLGPICLQAYCRLIKLTTVIIMFPGKCLCTVRSACKKDVDRAVLSAKAAYQKWRTYSGMERGVVLRQTARIIRVCSRSGMEAGREKEGGVGRR